MQHNRISAGNGKLARLFSLGMMGVIAALALGAVMALGSSPRVSATQLDEDHFDLEAHVTCVDNAPFEVEFEVHEHEENFDPPEAFVFTWDGEDLTGPTVGFAVEDDDCPAGTKVWFWLIDAETPDDGRITGSFSGLVFDAVDNTVEDPGPFKLGLDEHEDLDWDFALPYEEGDYDLTFKACAKTTTSTWVCSDPLEVTFTLVDASSP